MTNTEQTQDGSNPSTVDLDSIDNRNEKRIRKWLPMVLEEFPGYAPDYLAIQDIYALALNQLPARYTQRFSIVLREPIADSEIQLALRYAIQVVQTRPKNNPTA